MPGRNLFRKAFDDGTKTKLALFEGYLLEWLPVFLSREELIWPTVNIFDFFAGEGYDCEGTQGSPMLVLNNIKKYEDYIRRKNLKINVYLNEYDKEKFQTLEKHLVEYGEVDYINVFRYNEDFQEIFKKLYPLIIDNNAANLVFLDQNGIKQITEDVFLKLVNATTTDILFFISSSFFSRFSEHDAFTKHVRIKKDDLTNSNYYGIHRTILKFYKGLVPNTTQYYLAPFSIKKNTNIYGLIFGTRHTLGIEKFLIQSWKLDNVRGEANFDIDNDGHNIGQVDMFTNKVLGPKKIDSFEAELRKLIIAKKLKTNYQVYKYSLLNGFLPRHANVVLRNLAAEKLIRNDYNSTSGNIHYIKALNKQTTLII